jgi:biopolymer transport protein ExbD
VIPQGDGNDTVTGINVTPMVDITLVLLIVFMVTASFVSEQALHVRLPKVAAKEKAPTPAITVSLAADGEIKVMKEGTDLDGLRFRMAREAGLDPAVKVLVKADGALPYEKVAEALGAVKSGGVRNVALAVERP